MKLRLLSATTLAILALTARPAHAASVSSSQTAPAANGLDIANFGTPTSTDKWFYEDSGAGAAKGQTFTTGSTTGCQTGIA